MLPLHSSKASEAQCSKRVVLTYSRAAMHLSCSPGQLPHAVAQRSMLCQVRVLLPSPHKALHLLWPEKTQAGAKLQLPMDLAQPDASPLQSISLGRTRQVALPICKKVGSWSPVWSGRKEVRHW